MSILYKTIEAYHCYVYVMQQDGLVYRDMREAIDGDQIEDFFYRHSLDVMEDSEVPHLQQTLYLDLHRNLRHRVWRTHLWRIHVCWLA